MKKSVIMLPLFFIFQLIAGCNMTDDGSYTAPITIYEKLGGTWQLTKITEVDEIAKANSTEPSEFDLTTVFNFSDLQLQLNEDETNTPSTYEISGDVPELFPKSGYWKLDESFVHSDGTASTLLLYSDEAKTQQTGQLTLTAIPGATTTLGFKLTRSTDQTSYVSYVYQFSPNE